MNDIKDFSSDIISDIDKIINNSDLYGKLKSISKLYYKIYPNNEFDIEYIINNNETEIKIFGNDFVKNNKNNNYKIEYEGEEIELQEKLKIKNYDKNYIQIKLKNIKDITNMKNMFSGCSSLKYLFKNIVDVYDDNDYKKKNYQIIQTMNDIKDFSSDIKNDLDQVINNSDMYYKMRSIVKLFYKAFPENGFDIGYTINKNEKEIRVFGDDFVKNNKNNNCIIEYEGEEIELQEKLKIKNFDNDVIIIKLKNVNNITNMKGMFSGCLSLKYLHRLSSINTSKVVNMSAMFYNCSQLEKIDSILDLDISNVTDISGMFGGCSSLVEICDISIWDTGNIINMNGLFGNCSSLKTLPDISKWNISKVKYLNGLFFGCSSLEELPDISRWDVSSVINLSHIFQNCTSLKKLPDLSKWNLKNLDNIEYMFCSCKSLTSIPNISNWDTSKCTSFCMLFCDCSSLNELPDISKWNTSNVTNINSMFKSCVSLNHMPNIIRWDISNITDYSYYCEGCNKKIKPKLKFKK
jgi:surface protein